MVSLKVQYWAKFSLAYVLTIMHPPPQTFVYCFVASLHSGLGKVMPNIDFYSTFVLKVLNALNALCFPEPPACILSLNITALKGSNVERITEVSWRITGRYIYLPY